MKTRRIAAALLAALALAAWAATPRANPLASVNTGYFGSGHDGQGHRV